MPRRILIIFGTVLIFLTACTSIPSGLSPVTGFEADKYWVNGMKLPGWTTLSSET